LPAWLPRLSWLMGAGCSGTGSLPDPLPNPSQLSSSSLGSRGDLSAACEAASGDWRSEAEPCSFLTWSVDCEWIAIQRSRGKVCSTHCSTFRGSAAGRGV